MNLRNRNRSLLSKTNRAPVYWGISILLLVMLCFGGCSAYYNARETFTATVKKTERINSAKSSYYLVFTDRGEFCNSDDLLLGKFDSSSLYGRLEAGKQFEFEVVGWRVPFLSMYPNIVTAQEVK